MTTAVSVTVTHLQMTSADQFRPSHRSVEGVSLQLEELPTAAAVMAECYRRVGRDWHWHDRADWTATQWATLLQQPGSELWTARRDRELVGFYLLLLCGNDREVQYFGLVPEWIGRGIGGWLLTEAIRRAWATAPERVVLNTCSLDGPAALPNYLARGFMIEREEQQWRTLPE